MGALAGGPRGTQRRGAGAGRIVRLAAGGIGGRGMTDDVPKVQRGSALLFWGTAAAVIVVDQITKLLAERHLIRYVPREIFGDFVRFTLAYNPGAAFSMSLGENSRYIFGAFALIALFVLWRVYRLSGPAKRAGDRMRILALGLAWGGA